MRSKISFLFLAFFKWIEVYYMANWLGRTELLIGAEALEMLNNAHVLVIGLGGVGSYAAESLVRAGVGRITIIDGDAVDPTNKNRQLQALDSTIGVNKAILLQQRFLDINPSLNVQILQEFLEPDRMSEFLTEQDFDYVLDCIDSIQPKLRLIQVVRRLEIRLISSMGAGGKLDPARIKVSDISKTKDCKLAQHIRKSLKQLGITDRVLTVYSDEIQLDKSLAMTDGSKYKKSFYGTISYMPAMFGMTMAAEVIKNLTRQEKFKYK